MKRRIHIMTIAAMTSLALAACDSEGATTGSAESSASANSVVQPVIDPGDSGLYEVSIDPAAFTSVVDNPYLPKLPGMRWEYIELTTAGDLETVVVEVLDERRVVMGVETIVVHDTVTDADGTVVEDTYDWFAQDTDGNAWYFGEDTTAYDDGVASHEGAWEAGIGGALPGIVMPGDPHVSAIGYRQEYLAGEAEDMGQVIELGANVNVPAGSYEEVLRTTDWTPLDPDVVEHKAYAPGVGWIHESKREADGTVTIAVLTSFIN